MGSRGLATAVRLGVPDEVTTLWVGIAGINIQWMHSRRAPPYRVNCKVVEQA